jgi:serine/threonine protein kinase
MAYMAPEIFSSDKTCLPYGTKSDLFCLGVIIYIMMMGENPLKGNKELQFDRTLPVEWKSIELRKKWGQDAHDMIAGLLCEKSNRRWDAQKLLSCNFLDRPKENQDEDASTH